jgi:hypothetical protein
MTKSAAPCPTVVCPAGPPPRGPHGPLPGWPPRAHRKRPGGPTTTGSRPRGPHGRLPGLGRAPPRGGPPTVRYPAGRPRPPAMPHHGSPGPAPHGHLPGGPGGARFEAPLPGRRSTVRRPASPLSRSLTRPARPWGDASTRVNPSPSPAQGPRSQAQPAAAPHGPLTRRPLRGLTGPATAPLRGREVGSPRGTRGLKGPTPPRGAPRAPRSCPRPPACPATLRGPRGGPRRKGASGGEGWLRVPGRPARPRGEASRPYLTPGGPARLLRPGEKVALNRRGWLHGGPRGAGRSWPLFACASGQVAPSYIPTDHRAPSGRPANTPSAGGVAARWYLYGELHKHARCVPRPVTLRMPCPATVTPGPSPRGPASSPRWGPSPDARLTLSYPAWHRGWEIKVLPSVTHWTW